MFKVFVVRHAIGALMVGYLVYQAFALTPKIAVGSLVGLAAYIGVGVWMGARILKDIRRQEGQA